MPVITMQELCFEFRHIDVTGALRLACLALQTQIHHVVDPALAQKRPRLLVSLSPCLLVSLGLSDQSQAQSVRPAAGAVALVARGPERRAHRAALCLPANSRAVAQLNRAEETFLPRIVEDRFRRLRVGNIAQVLGHRGGIDDLAWVEQVVRIEGALHLPEGFVNHRAEHLAAPFAARQAVAVFAR